MLKNKRRNSKIRFKNNPLWSKKILFYRFKYKFLIINYIYMCIEKIIKTYRKSLQNI